MQKNKAKPFLKWAGGKSQLLKQLRAHYPQALLEKKIEKYVEPFVGGGAVFLDIMQNFEVKSAYISDINPDLVLAYRCIQQKPDDLCGFLEIYQKKYDKTPEKLRNELFLSVREKFNQNRNDTLAKHIEQAEIERVAQLIFLNKTCFNGLYRLNSKGGFNVPFGKYARPSILDSANIAAVSRVLQRAEVQHASYNACFEEVNSASFVYFDPPYKPISKTANFTSYAGNDFLDADQIALADFFKKLDHEKKPFLMLSNSDPKNENLDDNFFEELFSGFQMQRVSAARAINSKGEKRGKINELLITNYCSFPENSRLNFALSADV